MLIAIVEAIRDLHIGAYDLLLALLSTGSAGSS